MKLRAPAVPLITVDPFFSVWSDADRLNESSTVHWTGSPNVMLGTVTVDGEESRFMGRGRKIPAIEQECVDITALNTHYRFGNDKIKLDVDFYTPLFTDDLYRLSRPVSYFSASYSSADGQPHDVKITLKVSEEICLDKKAQQKVSTETADIGGGLTATKMGAAVQNVLCSEGDDKRIEWGYFYLCGPKDSKNGFEVFKPEFYDRDNEPAMTFAVTEFALCEGKKSTALFAYDDIYALEYFGEKIKAYWKKDGKTIEEAILEAYGESDEIFDGCLARHKELIDAADANRIEHGGADVCGEKYAELLTLAYRQVIAAHKLAVDGSGEIIFASKECFSNGCAATVDVTYPSAPFFMLHNTELLKGMMRPVFRYARSDEWTFDFAPHDVGTYPLLNGQKYGSDRRNDPEAYHKVQMPVEECGNMVILAANIALLEGNTEFFEKEADILAQWVKYLEKYGADPENQLCTDDFAGHLAHNCNLSLKAIMGIAGYSKVLAMQGKTDEAEKYMSEAREMAASWLERAANSDGSFRLAFDRPDTFSMKYNCVWDKLWGTKLFPPYAVFSEFASNKKHIHAYGMPLDNRKNYTKSDWLVWTATLAPTYGEFIDFITPLWNAYNVSMSRVPMTDWFDTDTANMISFKNRTVQGGLFIKLLEGKF